VITPGNPVAVDYGMQNDELTPEEKGSLVSEAIVLVASVPCQILVGEKSEERHQTLVMGSYKQEWAVSRGGGQRPRVRKKKVEGHIQRGTGDSQTWLLGRSNNAYNRRRW
jgi:hypothetical protein